MAKTEDYLNEFVDGLKKGWGDRLLSVILYGSAARGEAYTPKSDLNVLVVVKDLSLELLLLIEKTVRHGERKAGIVPIFWTEEELKSSTDIFPVEFLDMIQNHKVLYGADLLRGIQIDTSNLRHQIEFELRVKLLSLRGGWLSFADSPKSRADFLVRAGTSFMVLFEQSKKLGNGKLTESLAEPFRECVLLKKGQINLGKEDLVRLYGDVHESARKKIGRAHV